MIDDASRNRIKKLNDSLKKEITDRLREKPINLDECFYHPDFLKALIEEANKTKKETEK